MCWVDPGWTPGAYQSCSITPLLSWTGERKQNKRLIGQGRDRERSLTNYRHRRIDSTWGKIYLIYYQSNQSRIVRNKT